MASLEEFTQLISQSSWTDSQKQSVLAAIPNLGEHSQDTVWKIINSSDFELIKDSFANVILKLAELGTKAHDGDIREIPEFLKKVVDDPDFNFGTYAIGLMRDLPGWINSKDIEVGQDLIDAINIFEVGVFDDLSDEEWADILRNDVLYFLPRLNLLASFERRFLIEQANFDLTWTQKFIQALDQNEEILGSTKLTSIDGQRLPYIKNWLEDARPYLTSVNSGRDAYDEAKYVSTSKNVQTLNPEEKKLFLKLIDFYRWLLKPHFEIEPPIEKDLPIERASEQKFEISVPTPVTSSELVKPQIVAKPAPVSPKPRPTLVQPPKPVEASMPKPEATAKFVPAAPKPKLPAESYIVEDKPSPVAPPKPTEVEEEIKAKLKEMNVRAANPPMNIQDFLNQRTKARGGIVFDPAPKIETPSRKPTDKDADKVVDKPGEKPVVNEQPKAVVAPAPAKLPVAEPVETKTGLSADDIAKKLDELRSRKQS